MNRVPDPLRIEPHSESERSAYELREQYRADNLARIRALLTDYRINGVKMKLMGVPMALEGGNTPEARAKLMLAALDAPVTQNFGLADVPLELRTELLELADECEVFDRVTWADSVAGVVDHDAPATERNPYDMSEPELLAYVDDAIEESKRRG
jgi:hypothetical protein